jgi:hypothetical protein
VLRSSVAEGSPPTHAALSDLTGDAGQQKSLPSRHSPAHYQIPQSAEKKLGLPLSSSSGWLLFPTFPMKAENHRWGSFSTEPQGSSGQLNRGAVQLKALSHKIK